MQAAGSDPGFFQFRHYIASLLMFRNAPMTNVLVWLAILLTALTLAYIPMTHMAHFFLKWFTWDKIRWDDEPNVRGGRIERKISDALQYPVSWSAPHIKGDGKKNWVDVATEEVE